MDNEHIKLILEAVKLESFVKDYQASDSEAMGLLVAHYFHWDGLQIMETAISALEDANFHSEAAVIQELLNKDREV